MVSFGTLFSGGGGFDLGLIAAGLSHLWGVEMEPAIAAVYRQNIGECITASMLDVDPRQLSKVDWLHASPPCPSFSQAKTDRAETDLDIALAKKICEFVEVIQPTYFTLENVEGYKRSRSLQIIINKLYSIGYWADWQILNAADFGVPQTRKRLILRATKGFLPSLPAPVQWVGWYEAIADLIPTLPESQFAGWQLKRMPDELLQSCLVDVFNNARDCTVRNFDQPSPTVIAGAMRRPASTTRAFIVDGKSIHPGDRLTIRQLDEPTFSVVASALDRPCHAPKSWLDKGKVVSMTSRALARFQSFPDSYKLPENKTPVLACKILGNAVPPLLAQRIAESFIGV